jgi:amidase
VADSLWTAQFRLQIQAEGPLQGIRFAVKDLIDVAGSVTGCGNPDWRGQHPAAVAHAVCVEQLLQAGAICLGKTQTDELAFGLTGENAFYGTPPNPAAPDRVPGGSSSGSAVAVALGAVDVALGTDTGGSVRVPAANCGIFGWRPSHGRISVAGVAPLAPSFDTVGVLARTAESLSSVASVLLAESLPLSPAPLRILVPLEAWAAADPGIQKALEPILAKLAMHWSVERVGLGDLDPAAANLESWSTVFQTIQWAEIHSTLGTWIEQAQPHLGDRTAMNFQITRQLDRRLLPQALERCGRWRRALQLLCASGVLLCIPTVPIAAPLRGSLGRDRTQDHYFPRVLALNAVAGIGGLPQVTLPLAQVDQVPIGLSFLSAAGSDAWLLGVLPLLHSRLTASTHRIE